MAESWNNRGTAMMIVGGLLVAFAVVTIIFTEDPMPSAIAIIGLVSVCIGARKRRQLTR